MSLSVVPSPGRGGGGLTTLGARLRPDCFALAELRAAALPDARFIAIIDTALESPLDQVAMIPMLAWIARNAPANLKTTFFAVMASFTNLAFSACSLLTKHLNEILVVSREVIDPVSGAVEVAADYSELGWLLIVVAVVSVAVPLALIVVVQSSRLRTEQ